MPHTSEGIGYRNTDTSAQAADRVESRAGTLRASVLDVLRGASAPLSPDAVADILREDKLSIRPRFTELKDAGKIRDSGLRGKTDLGRPCILWEVVIGPAG
jgi:hypothetical protein